MFAIAIIAVLVIPCAIFMILVFIKSNQITPITPDQVLAEDSMTQVGSVNSDSGNSSTLIETDEDEEPTMTADQIRIRVANAKRERETVQAIMISVVSLAILYIPQVLYDFSIFVCLKMNSSEKEKCDFLEGMRPFVTEFAALYGIIQPAIFLWLCDQFWFAWDNRH
jgi:hypothetical protein